MLISCLACVAAAKDPSKPMSPQPEGVRTVVARTWNLNEYSRDFDGQWIGILMASDGNCYFAASSHSNRRGAGFFKYDPRADKTTRLCDDITTVCGETPTAAPPQGKIHSPIVECKGWLYFSTHLANYWDEASNAYTGGHFVGYEMATGKFRDYGVIRANYSSYAGVNVDPVGRKAYVFVTPFSPRERAALGKPHIYSIDLDSGDKKDLGTLGNTNRGETTYFFIDDNRDCWISMRGIDGALFRVRHDGKGIDSWKGVLPDGGASGKLAPSWTWGQRMPASSKFLFTISEGDAIWTFDAAKAPDWNEAFQRFATIGPSDLGMAVNARRIYYIQRADKMRGVKGDNQHLLSVSLDPANKAVFDHGLIVDGEGRRPWRIQSLAADDAGRVYMTGDWYVKDGEKGLLRHRDRPGAVFEEQIRGLFFAVADTAKDFPDADSRK